MRIDRRAGWIIVGGSSWGESLAAVIVGGVLQACSPLPLPPARPLPLPWPLPPAGSFDRLGTGWAPVSGSAGKGAPAPWVSGARRITTFRAPNTRPNSAAAFSKMAAIENEAGHLAVS